ncbi:MAG TPA: nickel transporter, partial [Actinomycetota bacterium]
MTGRRLALTLVLAASIFGGVGLFAAPAASAHPLGNFTVNRYSGLVLSPGGVTVHYVLDMAEIPTFQETPNIDTDGDGTVSDAERGAWAQRKAPDILSRLSLSVDGKPVQLHVVSAAMRFRPGQAGLPILYFTATFAGPVPGASGSVEYADRNYQGRIGWR